MSTISFTTNTYAGEAYEEKVFPALVKPKGLVDRGLVTLRPDIKKKKVMRIIDDSIEFQDPSATFDAQAGDIAIDERYLEPVKYEVMKEITFEQLRNSWDSIKLKAGSLNDYVPPADDEAALIEYWNEKIGIMNEQLYIFGKAGVTGGTVSFASAYPGMIGRLKADATVNKFKTENIGVATVTKLAATAITSANPGVVTVASTANLKTGDKVTIVDADGVAQQVGGVSINGQEFTITVLSATTFSLNATTTGGASTAATVVFVNASNVLEVMAFVYNNIPEAIRTMMDVKILVPNHIARAYHLAGGNAANTLNGGFLFKLGEMEQPTVEPMPHFPANTIVVYAASYMFLGLDSLSDEVNLRITDLSKSIGDEKYRYKLSMKTDVNHLRGNQILFIAPVTA